jgi:hypothetical protein
MGKTTLVTDMKWLPQIDVENMMKGNYVLEALSDGRTLMVTRFSWSSAGPLLRAFLRR